MRRAQKRTALRSKRRAVRISTVFQNLPRVLVWLTPDELWWTDDEPLLQLRPEDEPPLRPEPPPELLGGAFGVLVTTLVTKMSRWVVSASELAAR